MNESFKSPLHSKRANTLEIMSADLKNKLFILGKWVTNMFSTLHFENVVNTSTTIIERTNIYENVRSIATTTLNCYK